MNDKTGIDSHYVASSMATRNEVIDSHDLQMGAELLNEKLLTSSANAGDAFADWVDDLQDVAATSLPGCAALVA